MGRLYPCVWSHAKISGMPTSMWWETGPPKWHQKSTLVNEKALSPRLPGKAGHPDWGHWVGKERKVLVIFVSLNQKPHLGRKESVFWR